MRIVICFFLIAILISCSSKQDIKREYINGMNVITTKNNALGFFYNSKNELVIIRDMVNRFEYYFSNGDINKMEKVIYVDSTLFKIAQVDFDLISTDKKLSIDDENSKELIEDYYHNDEIKTIIYSYLPKPIDRQIRTSSMTVTGVDTSNYFFFDHCDSGIQIKTDNPLFMFDSKTMDSVIINYSSSFDSISFISPERHTYLPNLNQVKYESIQNSLIIPTKSDSIVGTLWTFFKTRQIDSKYAYHLIYNTGNLLERLKRKRLAISPIQFLQKETFKNRNLTEMIVESGLYELKGNQLIKKD
jgi:hypothetical protein